MVDTSNSQAQDTDIRFAIDIGSTVIKVAHIGNGDRLVAQDFYSRDFKVGIAKQVESLIDHVSAAGNDDNVLICSSANGGLRVGIICLTKHFSGATLRNEVQSAGANPIFVKTFDEDGGDPVFVDILLVGGGIDCEDAAPLENRLRCFKAEGYSFGALLYSGNRYLADIFTGLFPSASVIANPLANALGSRTGSVFEAVRRAYLDDLVHKEGVSELRNNLCRSIRPTPEIVNRGFQRALINRSSIQIAGACILMDVGGATTDFHYTVEIIRDDSENRPSAGSSIARYVFTDLGIVASRDSTLMQIRSHPRLYDFLTRVCNEDVREVYRSLREGEYSPSPQFLSYSCFFLGLDRFAQGRGPGLPVADLDKVAQIILTGGAAQGLDENVLERILDLFLTEGSGNPVILIDRNYQVWVDGITWLGRAPV
jgi:hypothetical protein